MYCLLFFLLMVFTISTLNVNGLNNKDKQLQLINFMFYNRIDILLLQEHNIRNENVICNELNDRYIVDINLAISHKGGTAILINRKSPIKLLVSEKSSDSRIISIKIKIYEEFFHIVNIYAHAGNVKDREKLFNDDLMYYLRNNLQKTIIGGDFNCVLRKRDTTSESTNISEALSNTTKTLQFKDMWNIKHKDVKFTYVRTNFGSRIDRLYAKDICNFITWIDVINVSFSDHSCVKCVIKMPNIPKAGIFYWKLNTALLELPDIESKFKMEWGRIKSFKNRYANINSWWDSYAKPQIKNFFMRIGREEKQKKYGLLNFLEYSLNRLYNEVNISGNVDYSKIQMIKDRIENIKLDILNGVKVRSRVEEQLQGEHVSAYLIKKQTNINSKYLITSIKAEPGILENVSNNTILNNKDSIQLYIQNYYENLYKEESFDIETQEWFLRFIDRKVSDEDSRWLDKELSEIEIHFAIINMNRNKSPGMDGLPIEFYVRFWREIKKELIEIAKNISKGMLLEEMQRKAIITLIHKDGELDRLKNWRPISLICADVKIIAKILAVRLGKIMSSIICENQFCVPNRSIIECTNKIRDILFYCSQKNLTGAILNLDWEKAFDRVNWVFLSRILHKMGFPVSIINWFMTFYKNIESVCMVNGHLSNPFKIKRGVRQGCPLSMLAFVLFQEPLYRALERYVNVIPPQIPGNKIKNIGYADDTTFFVANEQSLNEIFNILGLFEDASNSKLNLKKTRIYGFGEWQGRLKWPIKDIKVEVEQVKTLGIFFSINYNKALDATWKEVHKKLEKRTQMIKSQRFTLFQKAALVNSLISSKIWYVAHTYPLPVSIVNLIKKVIFNFIWKKDHIRRDVLCRPKLEGGIGLINIEMKAKAIFTSTTIKALINSEGESLIRFYLMEKVNKITKLGDDPRKKSNTCTPYYDTAIENIKKVHKMDKFPNVGSKEIYVSFLPKKPSRVEIRYPNYNWIKIWKCLHLKYINIMDRNITYKFLHEILPTNKNLKQMRINQDAKCKYCPEEDSHLHKFLYCPNIQESIQWLTGFIEDICSIKVHNLLNFVMLDFPYINKRMVNTLSVIMCSYLSCIWLNRDDMDYIGKKLKAKIIRERSFLKYLLKEKFCKIFCIRYNDIEISR